MATRVRTLTRAASRTAVLGMVTAGVVVVLGQAPAQADYRGSPGKIVTSSVLDGTITSWDPGTQTATRLTGDLRCPVAQNGNGTCVALDGLSNPQVAWSADGTKIAFSKWLADGTTNDGEPRYHSAIFVMDAGGANQHQVTTPPATVNSACDLDVDRPCNGAGFSDFSPTWSPDGTKLAFIRSANIARESQAQAPNGSQIWVVSAAGGAASPITHLGLGADEAFNMREDFGRPSGYESVAWSPDGAQLAAFRWLGLNGPFHLDVLPASGGGASTIYSSADTPISDYDWSPDGKRLAYVPEGSFAVTVRDSDGVRYDGGDASTEAVRFSPDGNGPIAFHCTGDAAHPTDCGLFEHLLPDPGSNLRVDDPDPRVAAVGPGTSPTPVDDSGRVPWDVQAQALPIVFLPGFLGSEIACGDETLWPPGAWPPTNGDHLRQMRLGSDGCAGAHPTGEALGSVLHSDIYEGVQDWLDDNASGEDGRPNHVVYGWDWRKSPDASIVGLNGAIDEALSADLPKRQGADRVVFLAHSYGGLLGRWYMNTPGNASRVARVLTAGTPWWGSPKVALPLAFGIESPLNEPGMDLVLPNDALQALARTIQGLYELFPSDHFGTWLSVNGKFQDQDGVAKTVAALGADPGLFPAARSHHQTIYDGFFTNHGRTNVQAVVGSGLPTFGAVDLGRTATAISWTNGDGTVPLRSAMQGTDPNHPFGDRVHVQEVCGVSHVALPNSAKVQDAYLDFLLYGRTPRKTEGHCEADGGELNVFDLHVDLPATPPGASGRRATAAATGPVTLAQAFQDKRVDLMDLPDRTAVITHAADPVPLTFKGNGLVFSYTPIHGATRGRTLKYGPLSGTFVVRPGSGTTAPVVTDNGVVVKPSTGTSAPTARSSAKLQVLRNSVKRHRFDLTARLSPAANGARVHVDVAAGGRHLRMTPKVAHGRVRVHRVLKGKWRHVTATTVRVTFGGTKRVRPASTSLVAAAHPAKLRPRSIVLHGRHLTVSGTVARPARGSVRLVLEWVSTTGKVSTWRGHVRISKGRWHLRGGVPSGARKGGDLTIRYAGSKKTALAGVQLVRHVVPR